MPDDIENAKNLDLIVKIADAAADYIKDNEEKTYTIIKKKEGHKELYPLRSQSFENWLGFINYKAFEAVATHKLKSDAIMHLEGVTRIDGKTHDVGLRLIGNKDFVEIDLGDSNWQSVYITKDGWEIGHHKNYFLS